LRQISDRWAVELNGSEVDQNAWRLLLKPPFDPFVEEIKDELGDFLALRSSAFDGIATSAEVHQTAKQIFATLNVAMAMHADTDPVTNGAVVEFLLEGGTRKDLYLELTGIPIQGRAGIVDIITRDSKGRAVAPPPVPSRAQLWMRAAELAPEIGGVLRYLRGKPGWIELYKAYEALHGRLNGGISKNEEERFRRTANSEERHHPSDKHKPHRRPMEIWEARALVTQWVSAAIDDILTKNP